MHQGNKWKFLGDLMSETQTTLKDTEEGLSDSLERRGMLAGKDDLLRGWEAGEMAH